ncbi:MAG: hypothetical protein SOV71_00950 [Anaerovoracaceae bacterium]|nr:hypothetical protein [Bacillota bacterium]MDY2670109.1 hypothetical protein [Anaerovoracaceae bacterium]
MSRYTLDDKGILTIKSDGENAEKAVSLLDKTGKATTIAAAVAAVALYLILFARQPGTNMLLEVIKAEFSDNVTPQAYSIVHKLDLIEPVKTVLGNLRGQDGFYSQTFAMMLARFKMMFADIFGFIRNIF